MSLHLKELLMQIINIFAESRCAKLNFMQFNMNIAFKKKNSLISIFTQENF